MPEFTSKPNHYYRQDRSELLHLIPSGIRTLLDVGCGGGHFCAAVKSRHPGIETWGIEMNEAAAQLASTQVDHVVCASFDSQAPLPAEYFDVICFNDSLEHFTEPFEPLAKARSLLTRQGMIICSVPNVRYIENLRHLLIEMDWKYEASGIRDNTHLRFFTRKSLVRTFCEAGFEVVTVEGLNRRSWAGWRTRLLQLAFSRWMADTMYLQFAIVARFKGQISDSSQN